MFAECTQAIQINKWLTFSPVTPLGGLATRNDLLEVNASIVGPLIECCSRVCPGALIMMVSNPINALVPFAAEILRKHNAFDSRRLFGVTTLDIVRAETFLNEKLGISLKHGKGAQVDVIGAHSAQTMVPLFSQVEIASNLSGEELDSLVHRE